MIYKSYVRKHNKKTICYMLSWLGLIVTIAALGYELFCNTDIFLAKNTSLYAGIFPNLWFNYLHYFTNQSNALTIIFYIMFIFFFHKKIFKTNTFLVLTASYITVTLIVFWIVLVPGYLISQSIKLDMSSILANISLHLICPLIFIIFTNQMFTYPNRSAIKINDTGSEFKYGMIYPICYCLYALIINFIPLPESIYNHNEHIIDFIPPPNHRFASVYSVITNFNTNSWIPKIDNSYLTDGGYLYNFGENGEKSSSGSLYLLMLFLIVFLIFAFTLIIYMRINNYVNSFTLVKVKLSKNIHEKSIEYNDTLD